MNYAINLMKRDRNGYAAVREPEDFKHLSFGIVFIKKDTELDDNLESIKDLLLKKGLKYWSEEPITNVDTEYKNDIGKVCKKNKFLLEGEWTKYMVNFKLVETDEQRLNATLSLLK